MVATRRSLLDYIKRKDETRYKALLESTTFVVEYSSRAFCARFRMISENRTPISGDDHAQERPEQSGSGPGKVPALRKDGRHPRYKDHGRIAGR